MTENQDYGGRIWRQYPEQIVGCRRLSADNFDNKASVAINWTPGSVQLYLYDANNCTGRQLSIGSYYTAHLSGYNPTWDNKVSSIKVALL